MKVVYTAPNRAHHYRYAKALYDAGLLHKFISGFSRFSPRADFKEIGDKLTRSDILQTLYVTSLKFGFNKKISADLTYFAKIEQDLASKRYLKGSDIFLFYNGSGLSSLQYAKKKGIISVVEAVNSHVSYQEQLLVEEYNTLGLNWTPFHAKEKERRLKEYELAEYILLPSEFVKNSFIEYGFPENKLIKVPYGFNNFAVKDSVKDSFEQKGSFTVLYVGSISVRKGLRYLINAFNSLNHPQKKLIIVGPKVNPSGIDDLVISNDIVFTGVLKGESLERVYSEADVFCLPTIEEGLALVLGEALSFGIPLIATENSGAQDLISNGIEGFIVPIRNQLSILDKLQLLADNPDILQKMKNSAKLKSKSLHGWDESGRLLVSKLSSLKF